MIWLPEKKPRRRAPGLKDNSQCNTANIAGALGSHLIWIKSRLRKKKAPATGARAPVSSDNMRRS